MEMKIIPFLFVVAFSCTNYDQNLPERKDSANANSIMENEMPLEVWLGRTRLGPGFDFVNDSSADVKLFKNDRFIDHLRWKRNSMLYISDSVVAKGANYRLEIENSKGEFLSSEEYFPNLPTVEQVEITKTEYPEDTVSVWKVVLRITNNDNTIFNYGGIMGISDSNSSEFKDLENYAYYFSHIKIDDKINTDGSFNLNLSADLYLTFYLKDKVNLHLYFYSPSLYRLIQISKNNGNGFFGDFYQSEPISINDFTGGVGLFGWKFEYILEM